MAWEKQIMEYLVKAGRTVEIQQMNMTVSSTAKPARRGKRAKPSTAAKLLRNEQSAVKECARVINGNFGVGDSWLTFRWPDLIAPSDKAEARLLFEKTLRKLRAEYRKATGKTLRYILAPSDRDPKSGRKVKPHIHMVMDRLAYEVVRQLWDPDYLHYVILDGRGDYTGIARYMCGNSSGGAGETVNGKKRWSTSKGLSKPSVDEPVPCRELGKFRVPVGAVISERQVIQDEESGRLYGYCRYVLPAPKPKETAAVRPRR